MASQRGDDALARLLAVGYIPPDAPAVHSTQCSIADAKRSLAPRHAQSVWQSGAPSVSVSIDGGAVVVDVDCAGPPTRLEDNVRRVPCAAFKCEHGDDLPREPTVLTECCAGWRALEWSVSTLAARGLGTVSLDGGPAFARMSLGNARASMDAYAAYCRAGADGDAAPLYVFDADVLSSSFADGSALASEWSTPKCFSHDAQAGVTGSEFRPLPPAWLLVGARRSGTPIHNHPTTAAWNALLSGSKAWVVLPPDVDEAALMLPVLEAAGAGEAPGRAEEASAFDLSALEWFARCAERTLPPRAHVIAQRPGEVVFVPAGWWHVVLNVTDATALSVSLALRRDIDELVPALLREDARFAMHWLSTLNISAARREELLRASRAEVAT